MRGKIVVNAVRCLGCKSCEIACAVEHSASQDLCQAILQNPASSTRVTVVQTPEGAEPLLCRQCPDAPCMAACRKGALSREDEESPVVVDDDRCIGCKLCVRACPYGVIRYDQEARVLIKCDQCYARTQRGLLPACVVACPSGALEFCVEMELETQPVGC